MHAGRKVEVPIDTQCFIASFDTAVVLAFRGSQPVDYLDWAYDFRINAQQPQTLQTLFGLTGMGGRRAQGLRRTYMARGVGVVDDQEGKNRLSLAAIAASTHMPALHILIAFGLYLQLQTRLTR